MVTVILCFMTIPYLKQAFSITDQITGQWSTVKRKDIEKPHKAIQCNKD